MVKAHRWRLLYGALFAVFLLFSLSACTAATSPGTQPLSLASPQIHSNTASTTLRSLAQKRGFFVGSTVDYEALQYEPLYSQTLAREFNMVEPENVMKWSAIRPNRNTFN